MLWRTLVVRKKVLALALGVVAVGAVGGVIAAQSDGGDAPTSVSGDDKAEVVDPEDEALQECVSSWNGSNTNKASVASIATAAQAENPTAYVHIGFSSVFPDRCLITVANPSTMYAQQYVQEGVSAWPIAPAWTGSVNDLDESNLPWNARMAQDGTIALV
ncbi:hypothetical protein KBY91_34290 [Streptomyces sp. RK23]|uniref:hypothetical protein n=1 Tax=unclassified Streptomyces TaxID=2593676 RepID=UPI001B38059F|nr:MULTISPECIES: hypothetical protein [unclassified Streptomyces]MBQ0968483.1 hypothetical protein [Streptomyces sp. RK74B]MBQ1008464.1 hypothetical protein [Streptomyces sp. RK23]